MERSSHSNKESTAESHSHDRPHQYVRQSRGPEGCRGLNTVPRKTQQIMARRTDYDPPSYAHNHRRGGQATQMSIARRSPRV